ncbi:MAG: LytTR family transcriptional regulator [Gammaproteobacteria bacterium]|nr:LytTR family transcriptional regulator [Gammaproteobacteria bacterium]
MTTVQVAKQPDGMGVRQIVEFYLLLPVIVGIFFGAASAGFQEFRTIGHRLAYMTVFSVISWGCYGLGAKLASLVLRPWRPSLLLVLVAGNVIGGFGLWWPLRDLLNSAFQPYLLPGSSFGPFWPPPSNNLGPYVAITLQGFVWWLLANWLDFRYRRVPRFGFVPPDRLQPGPRPEPTNAGQAEISRQQDRQETDAGRALPRLLARLPEKLQTAEILALEAEEHYTKVYTTAGRTLLLLRFSDAILEMDPQPGLQVHRSFWVSRHAVDRVVNAGRRMTVRLQGGLEIPVSRSYRQQVQAASLPGTRGDRQG